jgi:hypothetical protein
VEGPAEHARFRQAERRTGPAVTGPPGWLDQTIHSRRRKALRAALDAQAKLYPKEYHRDASDDGATSIVATHTLIPDALHHAFATFGALMSPDLPLTRRQHEMITTRVSAVNRCHY